MDKPIETGNQQNLFENIFEADFFADAFPPHTDSFRHEAVVTIKGKHHIIDGFVSEIYAVSHYNAADDLPEPSAMFVPTMLSPPHEGDETDGVFVGDSPYELFGFEPYISFDNNDLFRREGIFENYEMSLPGEICFPSSPNDPLVINYSNTGDCRISIFPDGFVELMFYNLLYKFSMYFKKDTTFTLYDGDDSIHDSQSVPLFIDTHSIGMKILDTSGNTCVCGSPAEITSCPVDKNFRLVISVSYTVRTPMGICEEVNAEFDVFSKQTVSH